MPHKQKRKRNDDVEKDRFNLAPSGRGKGMGVTSFRGDGGDADDGGDRGDGTGGGDRQQARNVKRKRDDSGASGVTGAISKGESGVISNGTRKTGATLRGNGSATSRDKEKEGSKVKRKKTKLSTVTGMDDTPKQFARLMAWTRDGRALRKGLDDGVRRKEKGKAEKAEKRKGDGDGRMTKDAATEAVQGTTANETSQPNTTLKTNSKKTNDAPESDPSPPLKILPGERLRDFAQRVDQSLPLTSVPRYSTKVPSSTQPGDPKSQTNKQNLTKHTKKLLKMQTMWREDEKRLQDKKKEQEEEDEEKREEEMVLWMDVDEERSRSRKKKGKRKGVEEEDPWEELVRKRAEEKKEKDDGVVVGGLGERIGKGKGNRQRDGRGHVLTAREAVQEPPKLGVVKNLFKD